MKISEAQSIYRAYRQDLIDQRKTLVAQRDALQEKYKATGSDEYSDQAAVLQLSIDENNEKFNKNQEVLDSLAEQYAAVWNAEVAKQQADAYSGMGVEYSRLLAVARRIAKGDQVPYTDEKKLMEFSSELYQMSKNAAMLRQAEKHEKHESLWKDDEDTSEKYDPQGKADNAEAQGDLPAIPTETTEIEIDFAAE